MSFKLTQRRLLVDKGLTVPALIVFLILAGISLNSCKTGYGCKTTEAYKIKTDKNGELSMKRGKTKLFDDKKSKRRRN